MINATKKWIFLKISGVLLIPLMTWFIINFIAIYDQDYFALVNFFTDTLSKLLFCVFVINGISNAPLIFKKIHFFVALIILYKIFSDQIKNYC